MAKTLSRRDWMAQAGMAAGAMALRGQMPMGKSAARAADSSRLEPFVDALVIPEVLAPVGRRASKAHGVADAPFYRVTMREAWVKMHRDLPPTRVWSYGKEAIGPVIEARKDAGVLVEWKNELPSRHFLPVDYTLHGSGREVPESRAVVHLHGGRTPAVSDGYPEDWFATGKSKVCFYPNRQDAAMLWYHDHAMGTSRLNLYAGLMGMYLLRDDAEAALKLPSGEREIPLMLSDRLFDGKGQLFYPVSEDAAHPWVETFAGDAMVVNGRVQPFHVVDACRYRLRIVNAANSRFFLLSLSNGAAMMQIGSDQGLLAEAVALKSLLLAPGERADVIVDFAASAGENVVLRNGAFGMMQWRVRKGPVADGTVVPARLRAVSRIAEGDAVRTRVMLLNEFDDPTGKSMVMLLNRTPWHMPVTETVKLGSTEIWSLVNLTDDTHPIHLHHVRFQVLDRRRFDRDLYLMESGKLRYLGEAIAPAAQEMGWKDVVHCPAGVITRIIVPFVGSPGRYVWHCHLQEHEANDMMRPYEIVS